MQQQVVRVDMRSRSRVGRGDLGANAARIATFLSGAHALVRAPHGILLMPLLGPIMLGRF